MQRGYLFIRPEQLCCSAVHEGWCGAPFPFDRSWCRRISARQLLLPLGMIETYFKSEWHLVFKRVSKKTGAKPSPLEEFGGFPVVTKRQDRDSDFLSHL